MSPDRTQTRARAIAARIRTARKTSGYSQEDVSQKLGFADRQTLSQIEMGERRVQPSELSRFSEIFDKPIEWFLDPFVVAGEANFSWRVADSVSDDVLCDFESQSGLWVGLLRYLRVSENGPAKPIAPSLRIGLKTTFEEAIALGEAVAVDLELGGIPSERLVDQIENKLDIPVLFVDGHPCSAGISGAMCRLPDLGVILVNRDESPVRRHFDVAHELFHALTWDAMTPEHRESSETNWSASKSRKRRIERLADNFAAGLLMPKSSLDELIEPEKTGDLDHLIAVAKLLQVSTWSLAYRLLNAKIIDNNVCKALCAIKTSRFPAPTPKRFSASFVTLVHDGIAKGHVSSRKVAKALSMTLAQLAELLQEHGKPVPFAM